MAKSKAYYDSHPAAKAKKNAYQKKYMQTEKAIGIRRRADEHRHKGSVGDGLDASHNKNGPGKHGWEAERSNRAKSNKRKLRIT